jgi:hypothetical protein
MRRDNPQGIAMNAERIKKTPLSLLLCAMIASGCATNPEPLAPDVRQRLGKVYLNSNGATGETYFRADLPKGGMTGAIAGAGKGAANNLESCLNNSISSGGLAPLVMLICTPLMVPIGIVRGSSAGSKAGVPEQTVENLEQQTHSLLQQADLSPALVATIDDMGQQIEKLAPYEMAHGILPAPEGKQTIYSVAAAWDYQTVMDIQVVKAGVDSVKGKVPMMYLSMTARVRLVEAATGKLIKEQDYEYDSTPQPVKYWINDETRQLVLAVAQANKALSKNIIDDVFIK